MLLCNVDTNNEELKLPTYGIWGVIRIVKINHRIHHPDDLTLSAYTPIRGLSTIFKKEPET